MLERAVRIRPSRITTMGFPELWLSKLQRVRADEQAGVPITNFSHWWKVLAEYSIRKAVNRAKKISAIVRLSEFNDALVEAISSTYNEAPVRQGKAFWHYEKDFQT